MRAGRALDDRLQDCGMETIINDTTLVRNREHTLIAQPGVQPEVGLRDIFAMIRRRKATIIATVLISTLITAVVVSVLPPTYSAVASIAMDRRGMNIGNWEQVTSELPGDESTFSSEIEVLRSRNLASRVVEQLELTRNPEFNVALRQDIGWLAKARGILNSFNSQDTPRLTREELEQIQTVATVSKFLDALDVGQVGNSSRVIEIEFTSRDRNLAPVVANTIAEAYLQSQVETKLEAGNQANKLLNEQIAALRMKVEESESAVEEYRKASGLLKGKDVTLTAQQTAEVNSQLVLAESAWAEAEARYQQIQSLMDSAGGAESAAQVLDSPLVKSLREEQSTIERNLAELSIVYGPRHPTIIKLEAEKADLERTIQTEMSKIVQGYQNEVEIARARYEAMRRSLEKLERQVGQANSAEIELRSLEREARANQSMLESFLTRFKETSAQQDLGLFMPDAKIISHAVAPLNPSFPNKKLFLALAIVTSSILGLLVVFVLENMDQGIRSSVDVEERLGVPLLALVPALKGFRRSRKLPANYLVENRSSALAQSIRALQTGISLGDFEKKPESILITSVEPGEGKTTISACLARTLAIAGTRVVVIDADFHKPSLAKALGVKNEIGFADWLAGNAELQDVVRRDKLTSASYITAGNTTSSSPTLLESEKARKFLHTLWVIFDVVIIDSPPLLAVADARILSDIVDATVLVARWGETKRNVVGMGVRQILSSGGNLAGIVLSQVDVQKNAMYGHPDSGAYSGALSYYYTK